MHTSKRSTAFTIVELMLVVAILGDLAVIALPAYMRSRTLAQNAKFINDLRVSTGAFEMYAAENNAYPPAAATSVIPTGMSLYLKSFDWSETNSIGGLWQWSPGYQNCTATIHVVFPSAPNELQMTDIDTRMDDGILATGAFREADTTDYYYIIEP